VIHSVFPQKSVLAFQSVCTPIYHLADPVNGMQSSTATTQRFPPDSFTESNPSAIGYAKLGQFGQISFLGACPRSICIPVVPLPACLKESPLSLRSSLLYFVTYVESVVDNSTCSKYVLHDGGNTKARPSPSRLHHLPPSFV
jgi:hypothetical protein